MKTFLSSTYVDLVSHRKAATEAVERLGQKVGRMEVFGARPAEPSTACLTEIDECDLFVGIYAHRYGYVPDGSHVSITEAEFDHAKSNNKPLFCFLVHEDHPWPPNMIEDEPGRSKLRDFKKKIGSGLVYDTFTTCEELAYKIAASLGRYLSTINNPETVRTTDPDLSTESEAPFGQRVICKLNCPDKRRRRKREATKPATKYKRFPARTSLHARPISFLIGLCDKFPHTEFRLSKEDRTSDDLSCRVDMKSLIAMMRGAFHDGDSVILEVRGKTEVMASTFLKIALENLDGYVDKPVATRKRISRLIDKVSGRLYDPDLDDLDDVIVRKSLEDLVPIDREYRVLAVINDRLHDVSLSMIPLIAKHFGCDLQIGFEHPNKGVFLFNMGAQNAYKLERRILELEIQVGTRITVVAAGTRREEAGTAVKNILQNLWQCDYWIRSRAKDWDSKAGVSDVIEYAREMARHVILDYGHVQNPFISSLITQSVFVNTAGKSFSKALALKQLAASHARLYDLPVAEILKRVKEGERKQTVVPRSGFAIAHAAMERTPRISISFGVYPDGVLWSKEDGMVKLVAMVLCAHDTYKTWADYRKRFSKLFREVEGLQSQLIATRKSDEFVDVLRTAELSLVKV